MSAAAERGGLEVIILNVVRGLDKSRYLPIVVFLTDGPFVQEVRDAGVEARVIDAGRVRQVGKGLCAIRAIIQLIRQQSVALVHTHGAKAHVFGGLAARIAGVPDLLHLQGVPRLSLSRDGFVNLLAVLVPAAKTVACSSYVAEAFHSAWPTRNHAVVVYSGIAPPVAGMSRESSGVRDEFGISDKAPLVVLATRLQRWKGVHVFVDSAELVLRVRPDARFLVVGGTLFGLEVGYAQELQRQARELDLGSSLTFAGYRPDVHRFFAAADIVAHCSIDSDPLPTVLLEAMSWGKPVIASDLGGPKEIVEHRKTGLLVEAGRSDVLAQAILELIQEPPLRLQMGSAGTHRFRSMFHADIMIRQMQSIYQELLARRYPSIRGGK